jgi:Cu2+-exporting ATPase
MGKLGQEELARLFHLVGNNPHPMALCLHEQLLGMPRSQSCEGVAWEEHPGFGVLCKDAAGVWTLGRPGWRGGDSATKEEGAPGQMEFSCNQEVLARFAFVETVRSDARAELAHLAERGLDTVILSGDRREKVASLAENLGLRSGAALGELTPREKADWVEKNGAAGAMMLGDGANDSLAFDRALCRGTPVVHRGVLEEKADFYYLGHGISGIRSLFEINDARRRTQRWLTVFSVSYNAAAVGLAISGHMNPLLAAVVMPVSSVLSLAIVGAGMRRQG